MFWARIHFIPQGGETAISEVRAAESLSDARTLCKLLVEKVRQTRPERILRLEICDSNGEFLEEVSN